MSQFDDEQLEQYRGTGLTPIEIKMLRAENERLRTEIKEITQELTGICLELVSAHKELDTFRSTKI